MSRPSSPTREPTYSLRAAGQNEPLHGYGIMAQAPVRRTRTPSTATAVIAGNRGGGSGWCGLGVCVCERQCDQAQIRAGQGGGEGQGHHESADLRYGVLPIIMSSSRAVPPLSCGFGGGERGDGSFATSTDSRVRPIDRPLPARQLRPETASLDGMRMPRAPWCPRVPPPLPEKRQHYRETTAFPISVEATIAA